ncbi:hypothetical protein Bca4012_075420 [Brassica carinata]
MVDFYLGVKWTSESAFKPYPKVLRIVKRSVLSGCEALFLSFEWECGLFRMACRGQHRFIQIILTCYYLLFGKSLALVCRMF